MSKQIMPLVGALLQSIGHFFSGSSLQEEDINNVVGHILQNPALESMEAQQLYLSCSTDAFLNHDYIGMHVRCCSDSTLPPRFEIPHPKSNAKVASPVFCLLASAEGTLPLPCKLPPLAIPPPPRETVTSMFF